MVSNSSIFQFSLFRPPRPPPSASASRRFCTSEHLHRTFYCAARVTLTDRRVSVVAYRSCVDACEWKCESDSWLRGAKPHVLSTRLVESRVFSMFVASYGLEQNSAGPLAGEGQRVRAAGCCWSSLIPNGNRDFKPAFCATDERIAQPVPCVVISSGDQITDSSPRLAFHLALFSVV